MKVSPLDVAQKKFAQKMRGYAPDEVDAFLDDVRGEMEAMLQRLHELEAMAAEQSRAIDHLRENERLLQETLTAAQDMAETIKNNARKEADIVLSEAAVEGQRIVSRAHGRRDSLLNDLRDLKQQRAEYLAELHGALERHRILLEVFEEEVQKRQSDESDVRVLGDLASSDS